jgi:hypothetical protein
VLRFQPSRSSSSGLPILIAQLATVPVASRTSMKKNASGVTQSDPGHGALQLHLPAGIVGCGKNGRCAPESSATQRHRETQIKAALINRILMLSISREPKLALRCALHPGAAKFAMGGAEVLDLTIGRNMDWFFPSDLFHPPQYERSSSLHPKPHSRSGLRRDRD